MGLETMAMSAMATLTDRPQLAAQLFRFTKWGSPFAPERFSYPYPMYDRMRADGEIAWGKPYRQWFVFGYDEVNEVLKSTDTSTSRIGELMLSTPKFKRLTPTARANFSKWLLTVDDPDHVRLRSAVARAFTPKQVARYETLVSSATNELLAALPTTNSLDIVEAFTNRLPIRVIADILDLPAERRDWLHLASRSVGAMLDATAPFDPPEVSQRFDELDTEFRQLIEQRRQSPGPDLVSALVSESDGPQLSDDEITAMITFLLFAGHETITGMLGTALVSLERHPEQRALLRSTPELINNAVEELLRFDTSAQVTGRQATEDIKVGNTTIRKGQNVAVMVGAANRDQRRWPDADQLRLDRPDPSPISFGFGARYCLGAALARMQLRTAIPVLLNELGDYNIDHPNVTWKRSFTLRGPLRLPITR